MFGCLVKKIKKDFVCSPLKCGWANRADTARLMMESDFIH